MSARPRMARASAVAISMVILALAHPSLTRAKAGGVLPIPMAASAGVIDVPESIDATGATDVSAALTDFFRSVADGSTVEFPAHARYRIETGVRIVDHGGLILDGNDALLFATTAGDRNRSLLSVRGGEDVTVRGLNLQGVNSQGGVDGQYDADLEAQHGVEILGTTRALVADNTITDVWGDFVYVGHDPRRDPPAWFKEATDVIVRGNTMARNGRQGVSVTDASRVLIADNDISEVRRSVFDLEPNSPSALVEDITIQSNTIGAKQLNFVSSGGDGPVNDVIVEDNVLVGAPMNSLVRSSPGQTRINWTFAGNRSDRGFGSTLGGVVVAAGVRGIDFVGNVQPMNKGRQMVGLMLAGESCGARAVDNVMDNAAGQMAGDNPPCVPSVDGQVDAPQGVADLPALTAFNAPQIIGVPQVDRPLSVADPTWSTEPGAVTYQWFADLRPVRRATEKTFVPTAALAGKSITVVARATRPGYWPGTAESVATDPVDLGQLQARIKPSIVGDVLLGHSLTLNPGATSAASSAAVTWFRDGVVVAGARGLTYRPSKPDLGHHVSARVTASRPGYEPLVQNVSTATAVRSEPRIHGIGHLRQSQWIIRLQVSAQGVRRCAGRVRLVVHGRNVATLRLDRAGGAVISLPASAIDGTSLKVRYLGSRMVVPGGGRLPLRP